MRISTVNGLKWGYNQNKVKVVVDRLYSQSHTN